MTKMFTRGIIEVVEAIKEQNDSAIIIFITELSNQLWKNNKVTF
jgi:hypothetical protein